MSRTNVLWVLGSLLAGGACSYERDEGLHGPVPVVFGASQAGSSGAGGRKSAGVPGSSASGASGATGKSSGGATRGTGGRPNLPPSDAGSANAGVCHAGSARCDAVEPVLRTCDDSGSWQAETCAFVCRAGACTGDCQPGERRCDGLQPLRCNDLGAWITDGQACDVLCQRGACTGTCTDGHTQCASANTEQTCANNVWGPPAPCPFTCVDGACGGECEPGTTRCASETEIETCSGSGSFGARSSCDFVCIEGACAGECRPGEKRCAGADLEECAPSGRWNRVTTCPNACVGTQCTVECAPGARSCTGSGKPSQKACNDQGIFVTSQCEPGESCAAGACGIFPRVIFVTSERFDGDLGGVSGADQKCQALADQAGIAGEFLALIAEPGRTLFDRFDGEGGPYQLTDGTVVANHFEELGSTLGALDLTELGTAPSEPDLGALSDAGRAELVDKCRERRLGSLVWCNAPVTSVGKSSCSGFSRSTGALGAFFCDWGAPDWDQPCGVSAPAEDEGYCKIRAPLVCIQR